MKTINFTQTLTALCAGRDLCDDEMRWTMQQIFSGEWSTAQISAIIVALKIKGEKTNEIAVAAQVMRQLAIPVPLSDEEKNNTIDTCGTGGDGTKTFNVSTTVSFVVAAAGVRVAKHGNRAMSSSSGSSDVLEALGVSHTSTPEKTAALIREIGIGFMFAPNHHSAMKHAAPVRKELGIRTLFNLLGPLSNPAGIRRQVVGVFSPDLLLPYAQTLMKLGSKRVWVVHGSGMDEISISATTDIAELKQGIITRFTIAPEDFGLVRSPVTAIQVASIDDSKAMMLSVLNDEKGAARDIVLINAAAALVVADKVSTLQEGIEIATNIITSGKARQKLDQFIIATNA